MVVFSNVMLGFWVVVFFRLWESRTKPTHLLRLRPGWGVDANLHLYYINIYILYTVYTYMTEPTLSQPKIRLHSPRSKQLVTPSNTKTT